LLVTAPTASTTLSAIIDRLPKSLVGDKRHPVKRQPALEGPEVQTAAASSVLRLSSPLPLPQLWIGWALPGFWGAYGASEDLLVRWVQQDLDLDYLRQEDPHIRNVRTSLVPGLRAAALMVRVLVDPEADPERVRQIVAGRVESLWTRASRHQALLERLKAVFDAELILNEPPQLERALAQAEAAAFMPQPVLYADRMAQINDIVPTELAKFAYKHLAQNHHRAILCTPGDVGQSAHQIGHAASTEPGGDTLFANAAAWDELELPDPLSPVTSGAVKLLPTGLTVIVARRQAASTTAWVAFRGGYADADPPLLLEVALRARPDATDAAKHGALTDRGATRDTSIEVVEFRPSDMAPRSTCCSRRRRRRCRSGRAARSSTGPSPTSMPTPTPRRIGLHRLSTGRCSDSTHWRGSCSRTTFPRLRVRMWTRESGACTTFAMPP
jgi:hypothetical protein